LFDFDQGLFVRNAYYQKMTINKKQALSHRWSHEVTTHSDALHLDNGVFTWSDPQRIAQSLQYSAESSHRRKGTSYQSAMSMLNFYINRAGKNLSEKQKAILEEAKKELRMLYDKAISY
jgi:hypothetical protein